MVLLSGKEGVGVWFDIWENWDSNWYLSIAENGYPNQPELGESRLGFFPLYPILIKLFSFVFGEVEDSGLIISGVCLIASAVYFYRLLILDYSKEAARNSVKYLFLFPCAFLLSGIFSESLFLLLLILCFYFAKRRLWRRAGIIGFLLAITRPVGFLAFIPLAVEYLDSKEWKVEQIKADALWLLLLPAGIFVFFSYLYMHTGSFWAFTQSKQAGWLIEAQNPVSALFTNMFTNVYYPGVDPIQFSYTFNSFFTFIYIAVFIVNFKKLKLSYLVLGIVLIIFPLASCGSTVMLGIERFYLVIFPIFIILGELTSTRPRLDQCLTVSLALIQGFMFALWVCDAPLVV